MFEGIGPWRSLASALAWGARGPEFKSRRPDQSLQRLTSLQPHSHSSTGSKLGPNPNSFATVAVVSMGVVCVVLSIARRRQHRFSLYMQNRTIAPMGPIRRRDQTGSRGVDGVVLLSFCVWRDGDNHLAIRPKRPTIPMAASTHRNNSALPVPAPDLT